MSERVVPARVIPEHVVVEIEFTPEEYERVKNDALWRGGGSVSSYVRGLALGKQYRGC